VLRLTGEPYHNALVWNDTRTTDICDDLAASAGGDRDRFRASTGLPLSPYFSASKMMYLLDKVSFTTVIMFLVS
jgi:glycerol kinase